MSENNDSSRRSILGILLNSILSVMYWTTSQAIMAKLLKMAKITQNSHSGLVWNGHKIWSMWVFYASSRINVHHQWKRNWKICIGSNVMAKTKSGVEFWPFPLYFWLFWGQKWPFHTIRWGERSIIENTHCGFEAKLFPKLNTIDISLVQPKII